VSAPVTIVEFTDYECPYCKQFYSGTFVELKKQYIDTGKVRWVTRDLHLKIHPHALKAAQAARCAGDQGKFWQMHNALLSSETSPEDGSIMKLADALSLDLHSFEICLESGSYLAKVRDDAAEESSMQLTHTPTFVVARSAKDKLDGMVLLGAQPFQAFQAPIDALLKNLSQ
jgi:protein-disulfide isomerase